MKRFIATIAIAALFAGTSTAGFRTPLRCGLHRVVAPCRCYCPITPVRNVASKIVSPQCCCDNCPCGNNCKCGVTTPIVPAAPKPDCGCPAPMPQKPEVKKQSNAA